MAATSEMRGCAILGPGGVLASSGDDSLWAEAARALLEAADRAAGNRATHAHVATEEGEAFATRSGDLAMVAVASRFALASLVLAFNGYTGYSVTVGAVGLAAAVNLI